MTTPNPNPHSKPARPRTCPRFRGHWWVIVYPDGDCYRELFEDEDTAKFLLRAIAIRNPDAVVMRVRLMSAVRPPGKSNKAKPKAVIYPRTGRPKRKQ